MPDRPIYVLLVAGLFLVGALFLGHILLIIAFRALRLAQEAIAARATRRAAPVVARYLGQELPLAEARTRLAALPRTPVRRFLRDHAPVVAGETRERLATLYARLGFTERDRRALRSRRWWEQLEAARGFATFPLVGPLTPLTRLLDHRRESVRLAAARALGRVGTEEAVRTLLRLVGTLSQLGLIEMAELLRSLGEPALGLLAEVIGAHPDPRVRADGAELGGELRAPALLPVLLRFAGDAELEVVIRAARALGSFPVTETAPVVRPLLGHEAWQVRAQAAKSLGRLGDIASAEALASALTDRSWWVRLNSAMALRSLGPIGEGRLRRVGRGDDAYAAEMAHRVLRLPVDGRTG